MAEDPLASDQWIAKTEHPVGVDLSVPPPEMRYQLLEGRVYTIQLFPNGEIAKGEIAIKDAGFPMDKGEGWYDWDGTFYGNDPSFPKWE